MPSNSFVLALYEIAREENSTESLEAIRNQAFAKLASGEAKSLVNSSLNGKSFGFTISKSADGGFEGASNYSTDRSTLYTQRSRRLVQISGRERRLKLQTNHTIARSIIDQHPHSIIGLEHLTDIGERTRRKRSKKASQKQRRANRHASKWAFAELHGILAYKAALSGSMTIKVDAHFTSQACPMCGYTSKANRPANGLLFVCQSCQFSLHADLVGARNITMRTLLIRQDWMRTGSLSGCLDVSSGEAKAARLQRYAELRWSLDASPVL